MKLMEEDPYLELTNEKEGKRKKYRRKGGDRREWREET